MSAATAGLQEAAIREQCRLLRMPAGSRWKLYVPAELAYGARGAGPKIPPNATLVFEVELLSIGAPPTD